MLSPLETGTARGRPRERGRSRETGSRAGTWPRRAARGAARTRQLASRRGEAGQGPSISYMEGPCLILPGSNVFARAGTPATPECQPRRSGVRTQHGRVLGRPRPGGSADGSRRAGNRPVQDGRSAGPQGWVPRRARSVCPAGSDGRRSWTGRAGDLGGRGAVMTRGQARLRVVIGDLAASFLGASG